MAPGEVRGPGRNPSVRSGVLGAETEQPSAATCRAWALGQPPGLSVLCRIGVRSACHFLPLRSDTFPSTRPEAWAGHGLWRPRLVFPWMLGGGRREEAGALGAGPVKAPLGSAVGVSGYSSTWGPAQPSTWAGVPSHVARKCEARRLSSTEDLAKGCPPSSPPRHLFPCSAEGCVRPRGRGTADGSLNMATRATKAVTRPRRPSHCCPPCTGFQGPHAPGVLGGPPPRQGVDTVRCHVCNTFACPRTPPLSPRPCHGGCRCVSSKSWPLSWSRVRGCGFQESSWGSPRPRPGRVVPWRGLGSRSLGCGASRVRGPLSSWEAADTMEVLRAASEGPTHLLVADWCEHTRTWAQPWGRSRPGVSRWDAGAGRVFCCFQR